MSLISRHWIHSTVFITNQWNSFGTGFLVSRKVNDTQSRIFLVTNKHVIHADSTTRFSATHIICHMNQKTTDGKIIEAALNLLLQHPGTGKPVWVEHPNPIVDILAIDVTHLIISNPNIVYTCVGYDFFATRDIIQTQDLTIGDDVMVIGYPSAFKQGDSNLPIVRQGIIASQLGKVYYEKGKDATGKELKREIPGFLIDGGFIPGSSGSPVVLKPVPGRLVHNTVQMGVTPPYLLGIVAETRFAPIPLASGGQAIGYAGLGMAFDASEIKATIELFFA